MPSSMIGTGRKFDAEEFKAKMETMNFVIVDNNDFPQIRVKFATGLELASRYPTGFIPPADREAFFADEQVPPAGPGSTISTSQLPEVPFCRENQSENLEDEAHCEERSHPLQP